MEVELEAHHPYRFYDALEELQAHLRRFSPPSKDLDFNRWLILRNLAPFMNKFLSKETEQFWEFSPEI